MANDKVELHRLPDAETVALAAAAAWVSTIGAARWRAGPVFVALSGGRFAALFFDALLAESRRLKTPFDHVHFFWADERVVPPDHAESNFALAQEHLFQPLGIEETNIHRVRGELGSKEACSEANAEIERVVHERRAGLPLLDLIFLGMGEDGHVASLFPDCPGGSPKGPQQAYRAVIGPKPPPERVTLDYPMLFAAREVFVLVTGAAKTPVLAKAIQMEERIPLGRVINAREKTIVMTDLPVKN